MSVVPPPSSEAVARSMRGNRRRDTGPERRLRSALHARGRRFRVDHLVRLEGRRVRPDIAFTRLRVAVFVDGCFWHCCPAHGRPPVSHSGYWGPKLLRNVERDRRDTALLESAGWAVLRLWEHLPLDEAVAAVERELKRAVAHGRPSPPPEDPPRGRASPDRARTGPSAAAAAPRRPG